MTYAINYNGLRRRETYEEIIDYLGSKQEKLKYPDRSAKQLRETPQLSNLLDGEGMSIVDVEKQHERAMEHQMAVNERRRLASQKGVPESHLDAMRQRPQTKIPTDDIAHDVPGAVYQAGQDVDMGVQVGEENINKQSAAYGAISKEGLPTHMTPAEQMAQLKQSLQRNNQLADAIIAQQTGSSSSTSIVPGEALDFQDLVNYFRTLYEKGLLDDETDDIYERAVDIYLRANEEGEEDVKSRVIQQLNILYKQQRTRMKKQGI